MSDAAREVIVEDIEGARWIRINRPAKMNALTIPMYEIMVDAMRRAESEPSISSIVFAGEGPAFTAGNDLHDFMKRSPDLADTLFSFIEGLARATVPLIAVVQGNAIGIGTTLLLHCEFVYAAPDARLRLPFIDLGLVPEAASSVLLARRIGHTHAARMLLLGDTLDAQEAQSLGLVTQVLPHAELAAAASATARKLAQKPPAALRTSKRLMRGDVEHIVDVMRTEGKAFMHQLASDEFRAAFQAFAQRRG